jgi:uncharacterized SAM-binding protein YcdF (DUF218 family)
MNTEDADVGAEVDKLAKVLLAYMRLDMPVRKSDIIIGMGALDIRIAEHAARLFLDGYADSIVFTGGHGKITKQSQVQTEAERFRDVAVSLGVPTDKILLEKEATSSGENIRFVQRMLKRKGLLPKSIIVVTKPYMERRAYAAFKKQWQDADTHITVTSPPLVYEDFFNETIPKRLFINLLVGDVQRIREYPKRGFQIAQDIPDDVWRAYEALVMLGYTDYLLT